MTALPVARYPLIDVFKALAAQFIVLHHFSVYGPVSKALHGAFPAVMGLLYEHGLIAVQVFFVVGGYLAARGLSSATAAWRTPSAAIFKRYARLLVPYLFALAVVMLCTVWIQPWLSADLAVPYPGWGQWLAHVTMLQSILGVESLSAGAWYVAMDFQLFALLTLMLWLSGGAQTKQGQAAVLALCVVSLLVFNRQVELDNWSLYFFGAYGLGALAWWARRRDKSGTPPVSLFEDLTYARGIFFLAFACGLLALVIDFRERIALAMAVALMLMFWGTASQLLANHTRIQTQIQTLGLHSYALFLMHFPMLLLTNAAFTRFGFTPETSSTATALGWGIAGWAASLGAANLFYRWIESPAAAWRGVLRFR